MTALKYGIGKTVDLPFAAAVDKTKKALQAEGFGVISEIDMQAKLKEKLGVTIGDYLILGACNPPLAHKALLADAEMGLLLPCNVIVTAQPDNRTLVAAIDPDSMIAVAGENPVIVEIARDAKGRLERAIAAI